MIHLAVRIEFGAAGAFGSGKAKLLELVAKEGSIRKAAAAMDMSYRQAWLLLQAIEETFGAPAIETMTGGSHGGGARLTELGATLLERYRDVEKRAAAAAAQDLDSFARLAKGKAAGKRPQRPETRRK